MLGPKPGQGQAGFSLLLSRQDSGLLHLLSRAALTTEIVKREVQSGKSVIQIARESRVTRQAVYRHLNKLKREAEAQEET